MKTRSEIYGVEAAELLRTVTMYPGILEMQLFRFYPGKEEKVKNLLSHLKRQGRIMQLESGGYVPYKAASGTVDGSTVKAVWILLDFIDQVDFHSVSDFPVKIIFFADGELYEIIPVPAGREILIAQALLRDKENPGRRIVLVDIPEQISSIDFPGISGFCTVDSLGKTIYYQKTNGGI